VIVKAYLVLSRNANGVIRARRVTTRRPGLDYDEALVRLELDVPSDVFDAPLITVAVERGDVAVAAEVLAPVEEGNGSDA
jgi:hypothetical protein